MKNDQQPALASGRGSLVGAGSVRRHENGVLAGLTHSDLSLLAPALNVVALRSEHKLGPGTLPADCVYFPHEGVISVLAITPDGETIEVASAGRAGAICPVIRSEFPDCLLVSTGSTRASRVPAARLQLILAESETLRETLETCRQALVLQLRQNLACAGLHSVEQRLPRWILETADRLESEVVAATQEDVARRLGIRRTTVTLMARRLQEVGAIHWARGRVEISDRTLLESATCTCYSALRERMRIRCT